MGGILGGIFFGGHALGGNLLYFSFFSLFFLYKYTLAFGGNYISKNKTPQRSLIFTSELWPSDQKVSSISMHSSKPSGIPIAKKNFLDSSYI